MLYRDFLALLTGDALVRVAAQWNALTHKPEGTAYFVALLDGADQFAEFQGDDPAAAREETFWRLTRLAVASQQGEVLLRPTDDEPPENRLCRDAVIATFSGEDALGRALAAALDTHGRLTLLNIEQPAAWERQIHGRIVLGTQNWRDTLVRVPQAQRGETLVGPNDWSSLTAREQRLLQAVQVRPGVPLEVWDELCEEAEQGPQLDDNSPHAVALAAVVARRLKHVRLAPRPDAVGHP